MPTEKPFFEDIARLAGGALGALSGVKDEIEASIKAQVERWAHSMDLISREEFEAVRAVATKAREEQEVLAERVAALETLAGRVAALETLAGRVAALEAKLGAGPQI